MKKHQNIDRIVEETLNSLDHAQRATANPYLFTRIKAGLEREKSNFWSKALVFISRPAVLTALVLAIFVNIILFVQSPAETGTNREGEQVFVSEYNLASSTIYDSTIEPE